MIVPSTPQKHLFSDDDNPSISATCHSHEQQLANKNDPVSSP